MSEKILDKLKQIETINIETIINKSISDVYKTNMLRVKYNNITSKLESIESLSIDNYLELFYNWVKMYSVDFIEYFKSIDSRNEFEEIITSDSESVINTKNLEYLGRLEFIKVFKIDFVNNLVQHLKIFKGTIKYIEYLLDMFVWLKYYNTSKCNTTNILDSGYISIGDRYRVVSSNPDYFGEGICDNMVFKAVNNTLITVQNQVYKMFPLNINEINIGTYQISSYCSDYDWNYVLKDLVTPIGWQIQYVDLSAVVEADTFYCNSVVIKDYDKEEWSYMSANIKNVIINRSKLTNCYIS